MILYWKIAYIQSMRENNHQLELDPNIAQPPLSEDEILLRKEFARLFIDTHDARETCIRLGFAEPYCTDWAVVFLNCGHTLQFIEKEKELRYSEAGLKDAKFFILRKLAELGDYCGAGFSHSARVAAWVAYSRILGINNDDANDAQSESQSVMLVPQFKNASHWSEVSEKSQETLKKQVLN